MNGTSTRLSKAQTASSLLTPGKTLTDATAPRHGIFLTICDNSIVMQRNVVTKHLGIIKWVLPRSFTAFRMTVEVIRNKDRARPVPTFGLYFFTEERSDEASRYHKVDVTEILRYALDDKVYVL